MTADEARKITKAAKNSEEELEKVISDITEAAKKGRSYVILSEDQLNLTYEKLKSLGYKFQRRPLGWFEVVW